MDIYARKSNYKLILLITGIVMGIGTVVYTNTLASKIAKEERYKVRLWAEAIGRKAKLVRYTKDLFSRLAAEERQKVNIYAQSTKLILSVEDKNNEVLTFFNEIITGNSDIPAILTDGKGNILGARNLDIPKETRMFAQLPADILAEFSRYDPIIVDYGFSKNFIYYKDSNLFTRLKLTLSDLVETFITEVVVNSASAPVILTDEKLNVIEYGNIDTALMNTPEAQLKMIKEMQVAHEPIRADLGEGVQRMIYYDDSSTLKQLRIFPYVQIGIFLAFLLISYFAFSNARRAEQNLVWVGMAKETAHQLGTPISSLEGWVEYLRELDEMKGQEHILTELEHDIGRLGLVADRFSKIGSIPQLSPEDVNETLKRNIGYMQKRASKKAMMSFTPATDVSININRQLFDWVLENLLKNALDAMGGEGSIHIDVSTEGTKVAIDVTDSGSGIPKGKFETIFEPGYSTKRRGWGLGLSLTKRIVEEYHQGKIFVKSSEVGKGTTFRILLPMG